MRFADADAEFKLINQSQVPRGVEGGGKPFLPSNHHSLVGLFDRTQVPTMPTKSALCKAFTLASLLVHAAAQSCANFGSASSSSSCLCPPGFGGSNCSQPACGGTIFDGSSRSLVPASGGSLNLTAAGCSCSTGWAGTGCNVCTTSSACQSAFTAVNGNASASAGLAGLSGANSTMVCNTQPTVYAAGELSCQINVCACILNSIESDTTVTTRIHRCRQSTHCRPI